MKLLVIGSGLSGAVLANKFANAGEKVVILEKREHIGGNVFDKKINGIKVHKYGPHIFHTDNEEVYKYMNNFWELNSHVHAVEGMVKNEIVPIPFNFTSIDKFWPNESEEIKKKLINNFGQDSKITIFDLLEEKDEQLKMIADFAYKNIVENYTTKMWDKKPTEIDPSVIKRVPVTIGYGNRYFTSKYEGLPKEGYTDALNKMLTHENIEIRLNVNALEVLDFKDNKFYFEGKVVECPIIYTGALDELFNYEYGILNYRSLKFKFEELKQKQFQSMSVVNYPADPTMTRITEYKNMTFDESDTTVISKEYPGKFDLNSKDFNVRYYPMANDESRKQYEKYAQMAGKINNFYPLGRLAEFKYYDMDKIIANALALAKKIL